MNADGSYLDCSDHIESVAQDVQQATGDDEPILNV